MKKSFYLVPLLLTLLAGCGNTTSSTSASSVSAASSNEPTTSESTSQAETVTYTATLDVVGEGTKKGITLAFVKDGKVIQSGVTDRKGQVSCTLTKDTYQVVAQDLPDGYYQTQDVTTGDDLSYTVNLSTKIIEKDMPEGTTYYKGSVMYDYELTYTDGTTAKLSALLQGKEAVVLNFWGTTCQYCVEEMPDLNTYYKAHKDDISLVAVNSYSPWEEDEDVDNFITEYDLAFPVTYYTTALVDNFGISGFPTTAVIDRYGRVANIYGGYIDSLSGFETLIGSVLGDDYSPSY